MKNIELFDYYTGKILANLYENFPIKQEIAGFEFCKIEEKSVKAQRLGADMDDEYMLELFCHTAVWLKEEGIIDYESGDEGNCSFLGVKLTSKGLGILSKEPKRLKSKESIGERIVKAFANKAVDVAIEATKSAILGA